MTQKEKDKKYETLADFTGIIDADEQFEKGNIKFVLCEEGKGKPFSRVENGIPKNVGWNKLKYLPDKETILKLVNEGYNLGFLPAVSETDDKIVMLDVDGAVDGDISFLKDLFNKIPTMKERTASGKMHLYFRTKQYVPDVMGEKNLSRYFTFPDDSDFADNNFFGGVELFGAEPIDEKAKKYVVCAGSNFNGNSYAIEGNINRFSDCLFVEDFAKYIYDFLIAEGFKPKMKYEDIINNVASSSNVNLPADIDGVAKYFYNIINNPKVDGKRNDVCLRFAGVFGRYINEDTTEKMLEDNRQNIVEFPTRIFNFNDFRHTILNGYYADDNKSTFGIPELEEILVELDLFNEKDFENFKKDIGVSPRENDWKYKKNIVNGKEIAFNLYLLFKDDRKPCYCYETNQLYWKNSKGIYEEFGIKDVETYIKYTKRVWNRDKIKITDFEKALEYVTESIDKNHKIIQFDNGYFENEKFHDGMIYENALPRIYLPFQYEAEPDFESTDLYREISRHIKSDYIANNELYYWIAFVYPMLPNLWGRGIFYIGEGSTYKSTTLKLAKYIYRNYSAIKLSELTKSEKFTLTSAIGCIINVDDDIDTGKQDVVIGAGSLKSFLTGGVSAITKKYENNATKIEPQDVPIFMGAGNKFPARVEDKAFDRRLFVILLNNPLPTHERNEAYTHRLLSGERDEEIGKMISYCLNLFLPIAYDCPFTADEEELFSNIWSLNSIAEKEVIKELYIPSMDIQRELYNIGISGRNSANKLPLNITADDGTEYELKINLRFEITGSILSDIKGWIENKTAIIGTKPQTNVEKIKKSFVSEGFEIIRNTSFVDGDGEIYKADAVRLLKKSTLKALENKDIDKLKELEEVEYIKQIEKV